MKIAFLKNKASLRFSEIKFSLKQRVKFAFLRISLLFKELKNLRSKNRAPFYFIELSFISKNQAVITSLMISMAPGRASFFSAFVSKMLFFGDVKQQLTRLSLNSKDLHIKHILEHADIVPDT